MASPQVQNGYTRIANEILEKVMQTPFNGTQFRILLAVWRLTYGFRRKEHEMSVSFLSNYINSSRSQVARELANLIERNILLVSDTGRRNTRVIQFNKNYEDWIEFAPKPTKKAVAKKPKQPRKKKTYDEQSTYSKMAKYFYDKVKDVAKSEGLEHLTIKADLQKWADDFRKLVEIDKVSDRKLILAVMDWVTSDEFWKRNVLSAKKFRDKFSELAIKMRATKKQMKQLQSDPRDKELEFQQWIQEGNDPDEFDWS